MNRSHSQTFSLFILKKILSFCILLMLVNGSYGQCPIMVTSFPYQERFETSGGNWVPGGTNSDWSWGTPIKAVISSPGEGTKSWITGGLVASSYTAAQNSTLESPCFDFTDLVYPRIKFKIFWETERRFDGATIQYSTNGGGNWLSLGDINSNNNCQGENWYNTPSITYLGNSVGWSGNIQPNAGSCLGGSGSGSWLTASHTLSFLAGEPQVQFRFVFGSGTTCNNFDGFSIDDVIIEEVPPNSATINSVCVSSNTVNFSSSASCATLSWNFGDPASGAANISTQANPSHVYSAPGEYNVTMIASFLTGPPVTRNLSISILGLNTSIINQVSCNGGNDGSAQALATGANGPYSYSWSTSPPQTTAVANNLSAGIYTVNVNAANSCSISAQVELVSPAPIDIRTMNTDAGCNSANGSIISSVSGGTAPYQYTWSNGATSSSIQNLSAGFYSLNIEDAHGCTASSSNMEIKNNSNTLRIDLGQDFNICPGDAVILNPGVYSSYLWHDNSTNSTFRVSAAGIYYVTVTDPSGCTATDSVNVTMDCNGVYFPTAFTPNGDYRNETFGPFGSIGSVTAYTLSVFNRYGERIFYSTNPYLRWDGKHAGMKQQSGAFTWVSTYVYNGKAESKKGMILLLR